ncbi:MAG: ABC transporter substrate-binding protein [bacterium]
MTNGNRLFGLALVLVLLLTVGCSSQLESGALDGPGEQDGITVTDCVGRKVQVPAQVERIACLSPESGHAMAMFGLGDKVVAATGGMRRDVLLTEMYPHIKDLPAPKTSGVINIEELLSTNPDMVFVRSDTASNEAEMEKMQKTGIPFLVVDYVDIKRQQYTLDMMGQALGVRDKAEAYNDYYCRIVEMVTDRLADIPPEKRVRLYHSVNEALRTDAQGTLPADWIQVAGAINVSVGQDLKLYEGDYYASLEQILLWDPEVIICNEPGVANYILSHEQWAPLQAVKANKVWQLPIGISRWGHHSSLETPLAILWTAHRLYPDLFADVDMRAETKQFFREFFNYELSDELVQDILSGEGMREAKG